MTCIPVALGANILLNDNEERTKEHIMATIPADARLLGFTLTTQYTQMLLPVSTAGLIESFSEAQELAEASLYDGGIEWVHVLAQYERDGKFGVIKFSDFLCEFCDEFPFGRMLSEAPA